MQMKYFVLLLSLLTITTCTYTISIASNCYFNESISLPIQTKSNKTTYLKLADSMDIYSLVNLSLCDVSQIDDTLKSFNDIPQALILANLNCSSNLKLLKNSSHFELLIFIQDNQDNVQSSQEEISSLFQLKTIFINQKVGAELLEIVKKCKSVKIQTFNDQQFRTRDALLPSVYFNPEQKHGFAYLREFYQHDLYERFLPYLKYEHLLLFTDTQCDGRCSKELDCLSSIKEQKQICFVSMSRRSGKEILIEQVRSYSILDLLGPQIWIKYVVLFADNGCDQSNQISRCAEKALIQMKINEKDIGIIKARTRKRANFEKINQIFQGQIKKIDRIEQQQSVYKTNVYRNLRNLCLTLQHILPQQCSDLNNYPINIRITNEIPFVKTFLEPNFLEKAEISRYVNIELSDSAFYLMSELVILFILDSNENFANYDMWSDSRYYSNYEMKSSIKSVQGVYGIKNVFERQDADFFSRKINQFTEVLIFNNSALKNRTLTLKMIFSAHPKYTLKLYHKSSVPRVTFQNPITDYISYERQKDNKDTSKIFELVLFDIESSTFSHYELTLRNSWPYLSFMILKDIEDSKSNRTGRDLLGKFINIHHNNPDIAYKLTKQALRSIMHLMTPTCSYEDNILTCYLYLHVFVSASPSNVRNYPAFFFDIGLKRLNLKDLKKPLTYFNENKNGSFISFKNMYMQYVNIANYGPTHYLLPMRLIHRKGYTPKLSVEFRVCKWGNMFCHLQDMSNWQQLYEDLTEIIEPKKNVLYYNGGQIMRQQSQIDFSLSTFQISRFRKQENITIFVVYKAKEPYFYENLTLQQRIVFSRLYSFMWVQNIRENYMVAKNHSARFRLVNQYIRNVSVYLIVKKSLNVRVFADAKLANGDKMVNFYSFNKSYNGQDNIKNANHYELIYQPGLQQKFNKSSADLYIDVFVESITEIKEVKPQVYYQIGWTSHAQPKTARKYILGENSQISAFSESYDKNKSQHYALYYNYGSKNISIISFDSVNGKDLFICRYFQTRKGEEQICNSSQTIRYYRGDNDSRIIRGFQHISDKRTPLLFNIFHSNKSQKGQYRLKIRTYQKVKQVKENSSDAESAKDYQQNFTQLVQQIQEIEEYQQEQKKTQKIDILVEDIQIKNQTKQKENILNSQSKSINQTINTIMEIQNKSEFSSQSINDSNQIHQKQIDQMRLDVETKIYNKTNNETASKESSINASMNENDNSTNNTIIVNNSSNQTIKSIQTIQNSINSTQNVSQQSVQEDNLPQTSIKLLQQQNHQFQKQNIVQDDVIYQIETTQQDKSTQISQNLSKANKKNESNQDNILILFGVVCVGFIILLIILAKIYLKLKKMMPSKPRTGELVEEVTDNEIKQIQNH